MKAVVLIVATVCSTSLLPLDKADVIQVLTRSLLWFDINKTTLVEAMQGQLDFFFQSD
jgi:hypothetical protein